MSLTSPSLLARRAGPVAALGALALCLAATAAWATKVTFRHQPVIGGVTMVSAAGTFNGWNAAANPLKDDDKDGVWEATLDLEPGRVEYKFVVNGDQWFTDETAADFSPDGFGGQNSVLLLKDKPVTVGLGSTVKKAEAAPKLGLRKVTFKFRPTAKPDRVSLAGTFNDWTVGRTPVTDPDGDGEYTVTLLLPVGSYQYKFVVGDNTWIQDKTGQDGETDDGFGGKNSIVNADDRFPRVEVKKGDGDVFADGVSHEQASSEVNHLGGGKVQFTARAHAGDVESVDFVQFTGAQPNITPMRRVNRDKVYDYYRAEVTLPDEASYAFRYRDGKKDWYLTSTGLKPAADQGRFTWDVTRFPAFVTPDWVKNGVIYQIFPDRFRNGSAANDPDFHEWYYDGKHTPPAAGKLNTDFQEYYHLMKDWNDFAALTHNPYTQDGRDWMAFYGGDVEGVRQGLDYLADLGVTVIYFNPIFEAKSTHKYDCADYRKIDPHFGTNDEFIAFVKEARAKGIRIILDIVYNHSGNSNWAFRDAAEKGQQSPTWSWYEFKKWPLPSGWPNVDHVWKPADYYKCWWGFGDLPDLNFDLSRSDPAENAVRDVAQAQPNIALVNYLLDTTEYWLKTADVDGVRLDVPNEVPPWFWKLFNQRVKKVKPDAYIVGELWGNATDWVKPGAFDAVMNYAFFRDPVARFLAMGQGTAAEFDATLASGRLAYPSQAVEAQMNLIDSHDTVRFLTQVGGNANRLKLAALFAMTYVGAPHIYYGDEVGMEGGKDPDCRRPFPWDWQKDAKRVALHDYYRKLIAARKSSAALRTGEFRTLYASGMLYGYVRSGGGEDWLVALNAGRQDAEMPVDLAAWGGKVRALDVLSGEAATWAAGATVKLPAESGRVFKLTKAAGAAAK